MEIKWFKASLSVSGSFDFTKKIPACLKFEIQALKRKGQKGSIRPGRSFSCSVGLITVNIWSEQMPCTRNLLFFGKGKCMFRRDDLKSLFKSCLNNPVINKPGLKVSFKTH